MCSGDIRLLFLIFLCFPDYHARASVHFIVPLSKWKWHHAFHCASVGLKRPEAEVAQLFPWLFKDNLHWKLSAPLWYQCHAKYYFLRLPGFMYSICSWYLRVCIFPPYSACVGLSSSCHWRTQLCSCVLNACLSDRLQPLISSLLGSHEYAWRPYLPVQSQMYCLLCQRGCLRLN